MKRRVLAGVVIVAACGGQRAPLSGTRSGACTGTTLEAQAPTPKNPFITGVTWLDASTVVVGIGGRVIDETTADGSHHQVLDIDPHSTGILVLDVAQQKILHSYRGASFIVAKPRAGSHTELLVLDGNYTDHGWRDQIGVVDIATGCLRASEGITAEGIVIDPAGDGFVVARGDQIHRTSNTIERWDAATLRPGSPRTVPRIDSMAYDAKTNLLVTSNYGDDTIRERDPITLDDRASKTLTVHVHDGFSLVPGRGEIAMAFETPCTRKNPPTEVLVECREPVQEHGMLVVGLAPLAEVHRGQTTTELDARRFAWAPDGSRAFAPCESERHLCEWIPDTGAVHLLEPPALGYGSKQTFAPDGDTYLAEGVHSTIDVRSMSTGALQWQLPIP